MASSRIGPGQVFSCEKAHLVFWFLNSQIELTDGLPHATKRYLSISDDRIRMLLNTNFIAS